MSFYYLKLRQEAIFVIITIFCQIKMLKGDGNILNTLNYPYPNCIELNNGNVLIVFSSGVYVFNSDLTQVITKKEYESGFSLSGDENDMNVINLSKFDDGVIIAIIKTYLYIFSSTGYYIHHINLNDDINGAKYYSLIPIKYEENNNYFFAITFLASLLAKINIYYYKINISSKAYEQINNLQYSNPLYEILGDKELTCLLISKEENEIICFYKILIGLFSTSFIFDDDNNINIGFTQICINDRLGGYYKSVANNDKTKALICYSNNGIGGNCIFYDIIENSFSKDIKYFGKCQNVPRDIHVYYFEETKEFIFSCVYGMYLSIIKFDSDGNIIGENNFIENPNYKFLGTGYSVFSYSIIFLSKYSQYFIIYTINTEESYFNSLSEGFNLSNIYDINEKTNIEETSKETIIDKTQTINGGNNFIMDLTSSDLKTEKVKSNDYSDITKNYSINESSNIVSSYISEDTTLINSVQIKESSSLSYLKGGLITEMAEIKDTDKNNVKDQEECSKFLNGDIKCLYCNEESLKLNKCIECNKELGYSPLKPKEKNEKFMYCYNNQSKLSNFYFDENSKSYNLCYELCNTCEYGGNQNENNCTSCISGYMLNPDIISSTNCIYKCQYYYYYNIFGQYRCTDSGQCPLDNSLFIRSKKKCVMNCNMDSTYPYQYNGECLEKCPDNTKLNEFNICEDNDIENCSLSNFKFELNIQEIKVDNIELSAINYAKEYSYTDNHISQFDNEYYSFILYKNGDCINKLALNFSIINFSTCYDKAQTYLGTNKNLIISIIKIKNSGNKPVTIYAIFDPETGEQINVENICKNDNITITENFIDFLKFPIYLFSVQKIDIFNLSGTFYTDICYHFESPNKKDVPLKDRILTFYPNISLCDKGCNYKGANLETFKAECECKINNFVDNYLTINNIIFADSAIGEAISFIKESNILVLKCYKDLFHSKYYLHNKGLYIISSLIIIQIICTVIFLKKDLLHIKQYIYNITNNFTKNSKTKIKSLLYPPKKDTKIAPNKKVKMSKRNSSIINENNILLNKINNSRMIKRYSTRKIFLKNSTKNLVSKDESSSNCNINKNIYINNKIEININTNANKIKPEKINFAEYLKTDLDDLDFDEALDKDKRKFFEIFINKAQEQHMIIRIFFNYDKIRPRSIKLFLFVFIINLYFVTNALMYNEEYISELYNSSEEESFFDFLNNSLPRLLTISTIGIIMSYLIELYFMNEKNLKKIFLRNLKNMEIKVKVLLFIKKMKKNYIYFIIVSFILSIAFWYYIFCFNNVYPNTSLNWIKSSLFIIVLIQLISFIYIFLWSFMRIVSLNCRSEWFFKISKISFDKN